MDHNVWEHSAIMESLQIAEHLRGAQAGGRTVLRTIALRTSIREQRNGTTRVVITVSILAIESILQAEDCLIFQSSEVHRCDASYVQRWWRLERET